MMEGEEKEIDVKLFAAMHRVASHGDFLHQKIVGVMGDYVEAQSFISDSIYMSHQDRGHLLALFPPRRLDVSYHGFGPRHRVLQPRVKVTPLQASTPKPILPPPSPPPPTLLTSFQLMAMHSPDSPKRMKNGTDVKVHDKKQPDDCVSTGLNSTVTPSSVTPSSVTPSPVTPYAVIPSSVIPSSVIPSSVIPSSVIPSSVIPSAVIPSLVTPSSVTPSSVTPSAGTPSSLTPSVIPSPVIPSLVIPSSVTVHIQQPSNVNGALSKPVSQPLQSEANGKSDESINSKQIEDLTLSNQIDRHQIIDICDMIKEITLPSLISPICSPEVRINVDIVLKEMMTNVFPLSPISNPERQHFTAPKKETPKSSSAGEACDRNPIMSPRSVQNVIGDISSSSDEEKDELLSADQLLVESTPPKPASLEGPNNVLSIGENKPGKCYASNSDEDSSRKEPEMKEPKDSENNLINTGLLKSDSKIPRPIFTKNLSDTSRIDQRTRDPCSNVKIPIVKTILENSDKGPRPTDYIKEFTDFTNNPIPSTDTFKLPNRFLHRKKIAPPRASQIVSRPNQMMPISIQGRDKQKPPSNMLLIKEDKTTHNNQPMKQNSPKSTIPIGLSYPKQEQPQKKLVAPNENGVPILLSNTTKDPCISKTSESFSNDRQSLILVSTAEQKPSSTRKDACGKNKIDVLPAGTQPSTIAVTAVRSLPISKLSNHPYNSQTSDFLDNESQPCTIASDEKSPTLNFLHANKPFSFLKGSPYSSVEQSKSTNEYEKEWLPPDESNKKMLRRRLVVSPYKLSPPSSPKTELSFLKFKKKTLQVKINLKLMNENYRKKLVCQISKRTAIPQSGKPEMLLPPSLSSHSSYKPKRKIKAVSVKKKLLIKLDTKLLSYVPSQNTSRNSLLGQRDTGPLTKRLCTTSLIQDQRQSQQETIEVDGNVEALLQHSSKSCYSRAKYLKDQSKIMKKEAQMFLHLLAANWFILCGYQMEKEGRSPNSIRSHLDGMASFLNEMGSFEDVRMEALRCLLQAVVCRKSYELRSKRRHQLQTELNIEYKSIFGLSFFAPESAFRKCLDQHQKTHKKDPSGKSVSVSYRFLQLNREYQSLVELLAKSEELLSKVQKLMQTKLRFFDLVKSRWQNVNVCLEIPLIVNFVKTCTELLQPKELGIIIKAQSR